MKYAPQCLIIVKYIFQFLITSWCILACFLWSHIEDQKILFCLFCLSFLGFLFFSFKKKLFFTGLIFFILNISLWFLQEPKHDRQWIDYQSKLPIVTINNNFIQIKNVRDDLRYIEGGSLNWLTKNYDLNELSEVRFAMVNLTEWKGIAHVFLSFNFNNKKFLSVSGEIRREINETFSPLKGLFRQYEMMIVLGTEKDLIGLRIFEHKDPITFYPLDISKHNAQKMLLNLLRDCQKILQTPRFYNTFTNNCATLIHDQLSSIYSKSYQWDLRLIFPGYTDSIAWDENLISAKGNFRETSQTYIINNTAQKYLSGNAWSLKIREN